MADSGLEIYFVHLERFNTVEGTRGDHEQKLQQLVMWKRCFVGIEASSIRHIDLNAGVS